MAIYTWTGQIGNDWSDFIPGSPAQSNWSGGAPGDIPGSEDTAVFDLGGSVALTADNPGVAEEIQIVDSTTVTFGSGHITAGFDEVGGLLIDEAGQLVVSGDGTLSDQGSLDIVGLTASGTLVLQQGAGFVDSGMIVGADAGSHGVVIADGVAGFEVAQSGSSASDGVLVVGEDGEGTVEMSDSAIYYAATAIIGENAGAVGNVTVSDATWAGNALFVGQGGTGNLTVEAGSTVVFATTTIGPDGDLVLTGAAGEVSSILSPEMTIAFGTLDVSGGGAVLLGAPSGDPGTVNIVGGFDLTGLGTIDGNIVLTGGTVEATQPLPGALVVNGNVTGPGTIEPDMTFEANGVIGPGVMVAFSPSLGDAVGDLVLDVPTGNLGTVTGFGVGNTIDVRGYQFDQTLFTQGTSGDAGTLTLSGGTSDPISFLVMGDYTANSFLATPGTADGVPDTIVTLVPCFAAGTRISTPYGEVAVEHLAVGQAVALHSGGSARVRWLGHRRAECHRHPRPWDILPVRVRAGALAPGRPHRDLRLSPDHAVFVNGALIPIRYLLNGATIAQEQVDTVTYWHVELPEHGVILAEGLPCETYLDTGNRGAFANGSGPVQLHPDFALRIWAARSCAPLVTDGPALEAARRDVLARLPELGYVITEDPGLHFHTDGGETITPQDFGGRLCLALPEGVRRLHIASRHAAPADLALAHPDHRRLGVALAQLCCDGEELPLDHPRFLTGWHAPEPGLRWTDGAGILDVTDIRLVALRLALCPLRYAVPPPAPQIFTVIPPSTTSTWPVQYAEALPAR